MELDRTLVKLIEATPGFKAHFYSNIKGALYLQIDPGYIYGMSITLRLQPILNLASWQGIHSVIIMDLVDVKLIQDAEQQFITLN